MSSLPDIPVVILAGGASSRFGSPKALAELNGKPLIAHVIDQLQPQTTGPIVINTNDPELFADFPQVCIADILPKGTGPLAGLHAALSWAEGEGHDAVVTSPVDTPFLPRDLIVKLSVAGEAAVAKTDERTHPLCGFWPAMLRERLELEVAGGLRTAHGWAKLAKAVELAFRKTDGVDPFFNINLNEDIQKASAVFSR